MNTKNLPEIKDAYCGYCRFYRYPSEIRKIKKVNTTVTKCVYCVNKSINYRKLHNENRKTKANNS